METWDDLDRHMHERPAKMGSMKKKRTAGSEVARQRDRLFESGSTFAKVDRREIVGIDSLVDQLNEVVLWLEHPEWFKQKEARLEPGILFSGAPGTGKTLLARYLASRSKALFISVRDWPVSSDMVTASDVNDLFRRAREAYAKTNRPVLIFWDEIEIYARKRSEISARDASVVSQLMSELDGVNGKCDGILFIGCTNYPGAIDEALKRHGRLGKQYAFVAPNRKGKQLLLEHYLARYPQTDLDLEGASYFLPAEAPAAGIEESCQAIWRKSLEIAFPDSQPLITQTILNDVLLEELLGPPPPFTEFDEATERRVAVHELGHALVAKAVGVGIQVMTIRPGESCFGRVFTVSDHMQGISNVSEYKAQICIGLGALAVENLFAQPVGSGIATDLKNVSKMAIEVIERMGQHPWAEALSWTHGRDRWGPINVTALEDRATYSESPVISLALLEYFDREECELLVDCYGIALKALAEVGTARIQRIADRFVQDKTWTGKQFDQVCKEIDSVQTWPSDCELSLEGAGAELLSKKQ